MFDQGSGQSDGEISRSGLFGNKPSTPYVKESDLPDAEYVDVPPDYNSTGNIECLYYPDTDYGICGYSDSDPELPVNFSCNDGGGLQSGAIGFTTRAEAENALSNYGYNQLILPLQLAGLGTYSKGYSEDPKFRWQAEIHYDQTTGRYCIWTDGPEPDPVFFWAFGGGAGAVDDWHDNY